MIHTQANFHVNMDANYAMAQASRAWEQTNSFLGSVMRGTYDSQVQTYMHTCI